MNNIMQLKYAVEVEKTGSISKAAENLYMGQPHLSRAIRELESFLGITIFNRTSKGVVPTEKGMEFLSHAKRILSQVEELETLFKKNNDGMYRFDISVPRASYVSYALTEFVKSLGVEKEIDINYRETNSTRALKNVAGGINNLAIVRYQTIYENYFLNALLEKEIRYRNIWEFEYLALMSCKHKLANKNALEYDDLADYTEIYHGDKSIPSLTVAESRQIIKAEEKRRKIAVYERGSQFELLTRVPETYMWVSPIPQDLLDRFELLQKKCDIPSNKYKDILIYRKGYHFSYEDNLFVEKLNESVGMVSQY